MAMQRTTTAQLNAIASRINRRLNKPLNKFADESLTHNVGHYMIETGSKMFGYAWRLVQVTNEQGGERLVISALSAKELERSMHAFICGIDAALGE